MRCGYMLELYKTYENFVTFYDDKFEEPNKTDNYIDWCQTVVDIIQNFMKY